MTISFGFSGVAFTLAGVALVIYAAGVLLKYAPHAIGAVAEAITALVELRRQPRGSERGPTLVPRSPYRLQREEPADGGARGVDADDALPAGVAPAPEPGALRDDIRLRGPRDIRWESVRHRPSVPASDATLETEAVIMSNYFEADREEWSDLPLVVAQPIARDSKLRQPPPGPPIEDDA